MRDKLDIFMESMMPFKLFIASIQFIGVLATAYIGVMTILKSDALNIIGGGILWGVALLQLCMVVYTIWSGYIDYKGRVEFEREINTNTTMGKDTTTEKINENIK